MYHLSSKDSISDTQNNLEENKKEENKKDESEKETSRVRGILITKHNSKFDTFVLLGSSNKRLTKEAANNVVNILDHLSSKDSVSDTQKEENKKDKEESEKETRSKQSGNETTSRNSSNTNRTTRTTRKSQNNEKKAASSTKIEENDKGLFIKRELIITNTFNIKQEKLSIQ